MVYHVFCIHRVFLYFIHPNWCETEFAHPPKAIPLPLRKSMSETVQSPQTSLRPARSPKCCRSRGHPSNTVRLQMPLQMRECRLTMSKTPLSHDNTLVPGSGLYVKCPCFGRSRYQRTAKNHQRSGRVAETKRAKWPWVKTPYPSEHPNLH